MATGGGRKHRLATRRTCKKSQKKLWEQEAPADNVPGEPSVSGSQSDQEKMTGRDLGGGSGTMGTPSILPCIALPLLEGYGF